VIAPATFGVVFALILGHVPTVSDLLLPEYELWKAAASSQVRLVGNVNQDFDAALGDLVDIATEYHAIRRLQYLKNRLHPLWSLFRDVGISTDRDLDEEDKALQLLNGKIRASYRERMKRMQEVLCRPDDPVAANALKRLLALVELRFGEKNMQVIYDRYEATLDAVRSC